MLQTQCAFYSLLAVALWKFGEEILLFEVVEVLENRFVVGRFTHSFLVGFESETEDEGSEGTQGTAQPDL